MTSEPQQDVSALVLEALRKGDVVGLQVLHLELVEELAALERQRNAMEQERERLRAASGRTRERAHERLLQAREVDRARFASMAQELRSRAASPALGELAGLVASAWAAHARAADDVFWAALADVVDAPPGHGYDEVFAEPNPGRVAELEEALRATGERMRALRDVLRTIPRDVARGVNAGPSRRATEYEVVR